MGWVRKHGVFLITAALIVFAWPGAMSQAGVCLNTITKAMHFGVADRLLLEDVQSKFKPVQRAAKRLPEEVQHMLELKFTEALNDSQKLESLQQTLKRAKALERYPTILEDYLREVLLLPPVPRTKVRFKYGDVLMERGWDEAAKRNKYTVVPNKDSAWNNYALRRLAKGRNITVEAHPAGLDAHGAGAYVIQKTETYDFNTLSENISDLVTHEGTHSVTNIKAERGLQTREQISFYISDSSLKTSPDLSAISTYEKHAVVNEVSAFANQSAQLGSQIAKTPVFEINNLRAITSKAANQLDWELSRIRDSARHYQAALEEIRNNPKAIKLVKEYGEAKYSLKIEVNIRLSTGVDVKKTIKVPISAEERSKFVAIQGSAKTHCNDIFGDLLMRESVKERLVREAQEKLREVQTNLAQGIASSTDNLELGRLMRQSSEFQKPDTHNIGKGR